MQRKRNRSAFIFGIVSALVIIFNIEFYPFSNYQMYSSAFLPRSTFTYMKITAVKIDGSEVPFENRRFNLFDSQAPLAEAIHNHTQKGKSLKELGLSLLRHTNKMDSSIIGIKFYEVIYDWPLYKKSILAASEKEQYTPEYKLLEQVQL